MNKYRHEMKFLINQREYDLLRLRLKHVLKTDGHYSQEQYKVSSIYFDDLNERGMHDKLDGLEKRKKFRIRTYNDQSNFIRLECKIKDTHYIKKVQKQLSEAEMTDMITGRYKRLPLKASQLSDDLIGYFYANRFLFRPVIKIDYLREAYLHEATGVRITFDQAIQYGNMDHRLTEKVAMRYLFREPTYILEVKYYHFLPLFIKNLLQLESFNQTALSKYAMCRLGLQNII